MTKRETERAERLLPGGIPRWVHCYDNGGETTDRYTVCFTGRYTHKTGGEHWVLGMSENPYHPQGVGMHSSYPQPVDYPRYSHLGRKIRFTDLPPACQRAGLADYCYLWGIPGVSAEADVHLERDKRRTASE